MFRLFEFSNFSGIARDRAQSDAREMLENCSAIALDFSRMVGKRGDFSGHARGRTHQKIPEKSRKFLEISSGIPRKFLGDAMRGRKSVNG